MTNRCGEKSWKGARRRPRREIRQHGTRLAHSGPCDRKKPNCSASRISPTSSSPGAWRKAGHRLAFHRGPARSHRAQRFHSRLPRLQEFKAESTHAPAGPLDPWETAYWSEKHRKALYEFDAEELRPYFPIDGVLGGTLPALRETVSRSHSSERETVFIEPGEERRPMASARPARAARSKSGIRKSGSTMSSTADGVPSDRSTPTGTRATRSAAGPG